MDDVISDSGTKIYLRKLGINTDVMYQPSSRSFVSHATGTELVIKYIEQNWAPTVTSTEMMHALPYTRRNGPVGSH
jgi:hypothetical protein